MVKVSVVNQKHKSSLAVTGLPFLQSLFSHQQQGQLGTSGGEGDRICKTMARGCCLVSPDPAPPGLELPHVFCLPFVAFTDCEMAGKHREGPGEAVQSVCDPRLLCVAL